MRLISLFILFGLGWAVSHAQTWQAMGPEGGQIHRGITVGNQLLIGTSSGVYRSTDGGTTFQPLSRGIPSGNVIDLFQDGNFLFACVVNKGIYRSADGGVTWELKLPGRYLSQNAIGIVRMQKADGHLMVRNSDELNDTLYFSPDFGNTWIKQALNPFSLLTNQVFGFGDVFLTNSLAGVLGPVQGLYRTEDLGQTWTFSGTGITPGLSVNNMVSIKDTLYALQKHIFRSTDNGLNWTQVTTDTLKNPNGSFAFSPAYYTVLGRTVYARNGGNASVVCTSWTPGQSRWQPPVTGSPTSGAGLTMFSHAGKMFQTGFNGEVFTASNPGQAWTPTTFRGVYSVVVNDLSASGNQVFATTASRFLAGGDGPNGWQITNPANIPDNFPLRAVTRVGSNLVMGVSDNFNGPLRMYFSTDQGATWQSADGTTLRPEARMRTFGDSALVFGTEGGAIPVAGVFNGQGQFVAGLTGASGFSGTTEWLAMARHKGELYGLATRISNPSSRLFRRNSTATNWTVVSQFLFPNGALSFESWQNKLYLGPALGGVLVSADDGANWTDLSTGLGGAVVNHLHAFGDFLAAATNKGIFLLEDGATAWTSLTGDLPVADFVKVQATPAYLWALAENGSVWRLWRGNGNVSVEPGRGNALFSLYPNPAAEVLMVESVPGTWRILDLTGRIMATGEIRQNEPKTVLPLNALPGGMYLIQVTAEGTSQTASFLKQ